MKKRTLLSLIALIGCLQGISSDIYAPSISAISDSFGTEVSIVQLSMSLFMMGVAATQLVYGPISDAYGRKKPLVFGLLLVLIGNIWCSLSVSIDMLLVGRLLQGFGAGACAALWRSIFRDSFEGESLAKYGGYLGIIMVFVVPAAPTLGGYLQTFFSWQASFYFLTGYSLFTLWFVLFRFQETSQHHHPDKLKMTYIFKTFSHLLKHPIFAGYSFCCLITYGAFFAWFVSGPVLLIQKLGMSPVHFGWFSFFGGGAAMALAGMINGRYVQRLGSHYLLRLGWVLTLLAGCLLLLGYYLVGLSISLILLPVILFFFGVTFIWPNIMAQAMMPFGHIAGYAGALYSFMQLSGAAFIGLLASYLHEETPVPIAVIMIVCSAFAWGLFESLEKQEAT